MNDLEILLALDATTRSKSDLDAVGHIVSRCQERAGIWSDVRESDGVPSFRFIERTTTRARVCGHIWSIDQALHTFWLDLESERWTIHFDIDPSTLSPRRLRDAADVINDPSEVVWLTTFSKS